jgi:hypothetical protein
MAKEVNILKNFRDNFLLTNSIGRNLVKFYYRVSPPIADYIVKHDNLRSVVRGGLLPLVGFSWLVLKIGTLTTFMLMLSLLSLMTATMIIFYRKMQLRSQKSQNIINKRR